MRSLIKYLLAGCGVFSLCYGGWIFMANLAALSQIVGIITMLLSAILISVSIDRR